MIILGGEPPFIDTPDPAFGDLLIKFNEVSANFQTKTVDFSNNTKKTLTDLQTALNTFVSTTLASVNAHVTAKGALHGETKATIKLDKKDNFPTATISQQQDLVNVNAFVTPAGAKAAITKLVGDFNPADYQQNDTIWMASYFNPKVYPVVTPTRVEPPRYLMPDSEVGILFNADRIILSPESDPSQYDTQLIFTSMPTITRSLIGMEEVINLDSNYLQNGWNSVGSMMSNGKVGLFKAVADKNLYSLTDHVGLTHKRPTMLLFNKSAAVTYQGVAASYETTQSAISLFLNFFYVDLNEINPDVNRLVDTTYMLNYTPMSGVTSTIVAEGAITTNLSDFISGPSGMTVEIDTSDPSYRPVMSLF